MFGFIGDIIGGIGNAIGGAVHTAQNIVGGVVHTAQEAVSGILGHPHPQKPKPAVRISQMHKHAIARHTHNPTAEMRSLEKERDMLRRRHAALTQRANQLQREMSSLQRQAAVKAQIAMETPGVPGSGGGTSYTPVKEEKKNNTLLYIGIGAAVIAAFLLMRRK